VFDPTYFNSEEKKKNKKKKTPTYTELHYTVLFPWWTPKGTTSFYTPVFEPKESLRYQPTMKTSVLSATLAQAAAVFAFGGDGYGFGGGWGGPGGGWGPQCAVSRSS
jgi:hypothetical protein